MFEKDQIIGRNFKVVARLGEGGMGQVYRALDVNLGRDVAIKFLLPDIAKDEEIVKRFLNEGRILATINHPAVISVYASDVEESSGIPFLVMEFVDGNSLDKHQEALQQNPSELIGHFIQLMSGIHACHQKGIIHRDLKPENLLINSNNQLKIVDFGIAKSASKHTKTGIALGTPHYMSPEQCLGKQDITAKTDVYAAGIILYEIFTGSLPFKTEGNVDDPALSIALMHLNQAPDFGIFANLDSGNEFKRLIEKMIAKKPEDRPEVPQILSELRAILNQRDDSEKPTVAKEAVKTDGAKTIGEIYEIQSELGSGGMGKVFKALDTALNRTVAIKVLHESTTRDNSLVERFIQEGQVLATVGHRNVMGIYASSRDRRTARPFLVMEYIEGKSLAKVKQVLGDDRRKAVPIMLQLAEGLAACHEKGIIHRDLKPGNIIITNSGIVKILDFGIAKTAANLTKTGMTVGTPEYMSPEQCTGSRNITGKSDIYSLGIIFWELIFGHVPFKADAETNPELSIALKHIEATLPAQAAIPDMSLVKIISLTRRMLDKDPNSRPEMPEIIDILSDFLEEHMPDAAPGRTSSGRRSEKRSASSISGLVQAAEAGENRKKKHTALVLIIIALLLATGTVLWKSQLFTKTPKINYEAEISQRISAADFNNARALLNDFETGGTDPAKVSALKVELSRAMIKKAEENAASLDYKSAINLYAQAIVLDPANPQAALNLSRLQQDFQKVEQQKIRIDELKNRATALLQVIGPASGTAELADCLKELNESGLATFTNDITARWQTKFISAGSPLIQSQPEAALQYFEDLQRFFPEFKEVGELAASAKAKSEELKNELANADRLNSLKSALEAAIANYTTATNQELMVKQIEKVSELGEKALAEDLKKRLAGKIAQEAEKMIVNNPQRAIVLLKNAQAIAPDLEGLETRLQLASDSLATLQSTEEKKIERDNLIKEISEEIDRLIPPADIAAVIDKIAQLEKYPRSGRRIDNLKDKLFEKYFAAVTPEIEKSPETARKILAYCEQLRPDAPGLKEIGANIEEKMRLEEARKKAAEDKQRAQRLETAKNAIFTGIKKDRIPEDLEKVFTEISALSRDYPESDAAEKLFGHLKSRCREEIDSYFKNGSNKLETTISQAKRLFADDKDFIAYLDTTTEKIAARNQLEEKKKAVAQQLKEIDAFIKTPQIDKVEALKENFEQIKTAISADEAAKAKNRVTAALQKRFENTENPDAAKAEFALMEAVDEKFKGKLEPELEKLAKKKVSAALKFIGDFKPALDINEINSRIANFDTWNRQLEKTEALEKLKKNFTDAATTMVDQDPEQAFELLVALQKVSGLANDTQIKNQAENIRKVISSGKAGQQLQSQIAEAEAIINQNKIRNSTDRLFQIIDFLKKNNQKEAERISGHIISRLAGEAEQMLAAQKLDDAEKTVALIRQFAPESETAQKIQINITNARKAAEKPKELVVGPTGTHRTIADAIAAAPEGMTIRIQPGSYNEKLVLNKGIKLVGEASSRCSINFSGQPTIILSGNASISNLTLNNTSPTPQPTVHVTGGTPEIKNCVLLNASPAKPPDYLGIVVISAGSPLLSENSFNSSKSMGITVTAGNPIISQNSISGCGLYGIWLNGSGNARINENTIKNNAKSGVGIKNHANPTFSANVIENNGENGMLIYADGKGNYEGNRLSNNALSGIEVWDAQPDSIRNNVIAGNRRDGINIRGGKAVVKLGVNQLNSGQEVKNSGGKIIQM